MRCPLGVVLVLKILRIDCIFIIKKKKVYQSAQKKVRKISWAALRNKP